MSGGSFNYLCFVEDHFGADEIFKRDSDLEDMAQALEQIAGNSAAARDTRLLLERMATIRKELTTTLKQLSPVWKAVEWERSGDWGMDCVHHELARYSEQHGSIIKLVDSDE